LTHSDAFYQRQFTTLNACIYDAKRDIGTMCLWSEHEGKRGSLELCNCIYKYVNENFTPLLLGEKRTLTVWSDRCSGQNNNWLTICIYKLLINQKFFSSVAQKFLSTGHSFMICDQFFALIEKKKTNSKVMVPQDWIQVIIDARPSKPFRIQKMNFNDFLDITELTQIIPKPPTLKISEVLHIEMDALHPDKLFSKESHNIPTVLFCHQIYAPYQFRIPFIHREMWVNEFLDHINFDSKYGAYLPISVNKKKDLLELCRYIPIEYRQFYQELTVVEM